MDIIDKLAEDIENGDISEELRSEPGYISFDRFMMDSNHGLTANISVGNGNRRVAKTVEVSDPFEVLGLCRDQNGGDWAKTIRFRDADKRVHVCHVRNGALHGDPAKLAAELGGEGLHIFRERQRDLAEYLNAVKPPGRIILVNRTGWHEIGGERVFVLPSGAINVPRSGASNSKVREIILFEGGASWV